MFLSIRTIQSRRRNLCPRRQQVRFLLPFSLVLISSYIAPQNYTLRLSRDQLVCSFDFFITFLCLCLPSLITRLEIVFQGKISRRVSIWFINLWWQWEKVKFVCSSYYYVGLLFKNQNNYLLRYRRMAVQAHSRLVPSKTLSRLLRVLNLTYFAIAVVFSALQNITTSLSTLFLPAIAIIHQLPAISSFLAILKLNLVTGIFFAQTPGHLRNMVSRCISLPLLFTHRPAVQKRSSVRNSMRLASVSEWLFAGVTIWLTCWVGWFNLIQKDYLHRDISIGNVVILEDAVTTQAFGILKN